MAGDFSLVDMAQIASGVAATIALGFNARAIVGQNRATTISTLNAFIDRSEKYEQLLHDAVGSPDFHRRYTDYLNHLEIQATAINNKLFPGISRKVARNRLIEDLAIVGTTKGAPDLMSELIDAPTTFNDIRRFIECNKPDFKRACDRRKATQSFYTNK